MEILGIGPLEIILVIVLALVVMGPQDMVASARRLGVWVRKASRSKFWREMMDTSREIQQIPTTLMRDSGMDETFKDIQQTSQLLRQEMGQAQTDLASQIQQANQMISGETGSAPPVEVSLTAAPLSAALPQGAAAPDESAVPPPADAEAPPPAPEDWQEAAGNQPKTYPFQPGEYPQAYPIEPPVPPEGSAAENHP